MCITFGDWTSQRLGRTPLYQAVYLWDSEASGQTEWCSPAHTPGAFTKAAMHQICMYGVWGGVQGGGGIAGVKEGMMHQGEFPRIPSTGMLPPEHR